MAGYYGYSMSNNAVAAYEQGEKPFSKWTKREILEKIEDQMNDGIQPGFSVDPKKISAALLKELFLYKSSWHHTSSMYNVTDFYSFNDERLETLDDEYLGNMMKAYQIMEENKKKSKERVEFGVITVTVWGGSRRRPRKVGTDTQAGVIKGKWLVYPDGKYKINANKVELFERFTTWSDLIKKFPQFKEQKVLSLSKE